MNTNKTKPNITYSKALIYCRVSSEKQVNEGNGLDSQELRCRQYSKTKGYDVIDVFRDEGISGALFSRPSMDKLIAFLDKHPLENYVIIFDDLKRLARDVTTHFKIKSELVGRGAKIESPNFNFEDSPEGEFVETIIAASAALERNQNKRKVVQFQKARLESGYWPFCNPTAYKFTTDSIHKKLLVRKEPQATIIKDLIEKFEAGIIPNVSKARDYLQQEYTVRGLSTKRPSENTVKKILTNALLAGYIEYKPWEVSLRKGKHEGIVSIETYTNVQKILNSKVRKGIRKSHSDSFPLRGHVTCNHCGKPLTGSFSSGRGGKYGYYSCHSKGCIYRYKTINKIVMETNFLELLSNATLNSEVKNLTEEIFKRVWKEFESNEIKRHQALISRVTLIDTEVATLMRRLTLTDKEEMVKLYEENISKLTAEKTSLEEALSGTKFDTETFGTALSKVFNTLENPVDTWKTSYLEDRHSLINMFFGGNLVYDYKVGFGTTTLSSEINLIKGLSTQNKSLVEMGRVELPS